MTFAKGYYVSVYGRISSEWQWKGIHWIYKTTVPANTTATLYLPARRMDQITENGKPIPQWKGVRQAAGQVILPLGSGTYTFFINQ